MVGEMTFGRVEVDVIEGAGELAGELGGVSLRICKYTRDGESRRGGGGIVEQGIKAVAAYLIKAFLKL